MRGGFTLIEVLIVVVIIGITAMMAVPMLTAAGSVQVRSAANMLAADLEYAKSMAISRGQRYSVSFDTADENYWLLDEDGDTIEHPVRKGFSYSFDFDESDRLSDVVISSCAFEPGSRSVVTFDYLGCPYSGSDMSNALSSGYVRLRGGKVTLDVNIEPVTGYISITD